MQISNYRIRKLEKLTRSEVLQSILSSTVTVKVEVTSSSAWGSDVMDDPGFTWDNDDVLKAAPTSDYGSGADEDDENVKKLTKREKMELEEREEEELKRREKQLMDDTTAAQNAADWERLINSDPDNSMLWIRYMAFHIHATEVDKARAVAARALKTINFRQENEKLNVWVSLLNLENLYGDDVIMEDTLRRALSENDQLKVFQHLTTIYTQSGKHDKATDIYERMLKKFRNEKEVWLSYMRHLMSQEKGNIQQVLARCLKAIERKYHIEVISKVGQMEFKHGDVERGRTIFEGLVNNFPKRTDVWSIYIDMLIQAKKVEDAREIFYRITSIHLSTKKIASFFKRFIEFERNYGNENTLNQAKQRAMDHLEGSA